jgi:cell division transport system ATP-binding protein
LCAAELHASTAPPSPPAVTAQARGLALRYAGAAEAVIQGLDLTLAGGSGLVVIGPSGSGKSTLLRLLGTALAPTAGSLSLFGRDVARLDRDALAGLRRRIGILFQDNRLMPAVTVFDNIALPLRLRGLAGAELETRLAPLLERLGLAPRRARRVGELSIGQQRIVAFGRALAGDPKLLLVDEPMAHLDLTRMSLVTTLLAEQRALGRTVVMTAVDDVSADLRDFDQARLVGGMLRQPGPRSPLAAPPATLALARAG